MIYTAAWSVRRFPSQVSQGFWISQKEGFLKAEEHLFRPCNASQRKGQRINAL
jgi:hypothetical protein